MSKQFLLTVPQRLGLTGLLVHSPNPGIDFFFVCGVVADRGLYLCPCQAQPPGCLIDGLLPAGLDIANDSDDLPHVWALADRCSTSRWPGSEEDPRMRLHPEPFLDQALDQLRSGLAAAARARLDLVERAFVEPQGEKTSWQRGSATA